MYISKSKQLIILSCSDWMMCSKEMELELRFNDVLKVWQSSQMRSNKELQQQKTHKLHMSTARYKKREHDVQMPA
jgi:hypothetical protein